MATYRIRMKWDHDPTSLWRDVELGSECTLGDLARTFTPNAGLTDTAHLWFFGVDGKYWNSPVKYLSHREYKDEKAKRSDPTSFRRTRDEIKNADDTTFSELNLDEGDRLTYLFDYGDGWRFYGIVKEINESGPHDRTPEIKKRKGGYLNQYIRDPDEPVVIPAEEYEQQFELSTDEESSTDTSSNEQADVNQLVKWALDCESPKQFLDQASSVKFPYELITEQPDPENVSNYYRSVIKGFWLHVPRPDDNLRVPIETKQYSHVELSPEDFKDVGRNELCPCGSGDKYKYCCLDKNNPGTLDFANDDVTKFDTEELTEQALTALDDTELISLDTPEDPHRTMLVVEEMDRRGLYESAIPLLRRRVPPKATFEHSDWFALSYLFDYLLDLEGKDTFEDELETYLDKSESHLYFTFGLVRGISRYIDRSNMLGSSLEHPQLNSSELDETYVNNLINLLFELHDGDEKRLRVKTREFTTVLENHLPGDLAENHSQTEPLLKSAHFARMFAGSMKSAPELVRIITSGEFKPEDFDAEAFSTRMLLHNSIPEPAASPIELESIEDNQWRFKQPASETGEGIEPRGPGTHDPFETAMNHIHNNPADLNGYVDMAHILLERSYPAPANALVESGIQLAEQAYPEDFSPESDFLKWGHLENRPYLRLKGLKMKLVGHFHERHREALELGLELLDLNPGDNQGVRESAVGYALWSREPETAMDVIEDYPGDRLPGMMYGKALALFWLGHETKAHQALVEAIETLPNVAEFLLQPREPEPDEPKAPGIIHGGEEEASIYSKRWRHVWEHYGGAMEWLEDRYQRTGVS